MSHKFDVGTYAIDTASQQKSIVKILTVCGDERLCQYPHPPYPAGYQESVNVSELAEVPAGTEIKEALYRTVVEEVTELLAQDGIIVDPAPQPTWEQVLMIPEGESRYKVGDKARYLGRPVKILQIYKEKDVCLVSNVFIIDAQTDELAGEPFQATFEALSSLHEDDQDDKSKIAQLEIDLAKARDEASSQIATLEQLLSDAQAEIVTLNTRLSEAQKQPDLADYEAKLKAQLDISNSLVRDLENLEKERQEREPLLQHTLHDVEQFKTLLEEERRLHQQAASALKGAREDNERLGLIFDAQQAEISSLKAELSALKELDKAPDDDDEASYLERLIMETGAELKAEIEALKAVPQTQRRKVEVKIFYKLADEDYTNVDLGADLTKLLAEGWEIAYEVHECAQIAHNSSYFARLTREVQETDFVPMDVDVKKPEVATMPAPLPEQQQPEPEPEPLMIIIDEEPELEPVGAGEYLFAQSARQMPSMSRSSAPRGNMQRRRPVVGVPGPRYADDALEHEVMPDGKLRLGKWFTIDPKKMPLVATMIQHGADAVLDAQDEQIKSAFAKGVAEYQQKNPPRKLPPFPTLGAGAS